MQLTTEQKNQIAAFLRKQDESFVGLPADARVRALGEVKKRIRTEIIKLGQDAVTDEQIESILGRMKVALRSKNDEVQERTTEPKEKPPATAQPVHETSNADRDLVVQPPTWDPEKAKAEPLVEEPPKPAKEEQTESGVGDASSDDDMEEEQIDFGDRHWLGVCVAIGDRRRMDPKLLRIGFVLLGLVTGPMALIVYCIAYIGDVIRNPNDYPKANGRAASWQIMRALVIALALYFGAWVVLYGANELYTTFIGGMAELEQFGAVMEYDRRALFFVLFAALPMALLSGLPMAHRWDRTMALLSNTVLALYAVFLSLGVSSTLAGYLLSVFQNFRG